MRLTLPALEKIIWQKAGNKNSVKQVLDNEIQGNFEFVSSNRGYVIIVTNKIHYHLVTKLEYAPEDAEYVLRVNKKATEERLTNNEIKFREWLKHPKLITYTYQDVINSWKNTADINLKVIVNQ